MLHVGYISFGFKYTSSYFIIVTFASLLVKRYLHLLHLSVFIVTYASLLVKLPRGRRHSTEEKYCVSIAYSTRLKSFLDVSGVDRFGVCLQSCFGGHVYKQIRAFRW